MIASDEAKAIIEENSLCNMIKLESQEQHKELKTENGKDEDLEDLQYLFKGIKTFPED
ncbi:hypothetical protein CLPU_6c00130 [Gottschalkia purinilytica]|uniref:Uncharacterized protein n=1 Tax=Gottschalkia purinilytica TaxID=1503 RepID=A0A0L0WAQ0_GOTPU|nr:hypothetical protein [Gottschalkia purinilytica]KNF08527.1 hypothetical protein CLPU_6c00130 [Gottschalkia purinilytica]